jgi:hypothetical protein
METFDLTQFAFGAAMLVGLVNIVKLAVDQNWRSLALAMTAVVGGLLFGFLGWFGIPSPEIGLALALASSGVYEIAQRAGGQ